MSLRFALIFACGLATAPVSAKPDKAIEAALDRSVPATLGRTGVPSISIAIVRNRRIVAVRAYGWAAPGVRATPATLYNLASLTKPISAEAVLRAVDRKWIGLDQPLAPIWMDPDVAKDPRSAKITFQLALSHRTGFPNWRRETSGKLSFVRDPGMRFGYSGEGYELAAMVLQTARNQQFSDLANQLVFRPTGMGETRYRPAAGTSIRWAHPHAKGKFLAPQVARTWVASDDAFSTASDYARFLIAVSRGQGLNRELARQRISVHADRTAEMCSAKVSHVCPIKVGMGLGWEVQQYPGETILTHTGSDEGTFTFAYVGVRSGDGAVILTNGEKGGFAALEALDATNAYAPFLRFLHGLAGV